MQAKAASNPSLRPSTLVTGRQVVRSEGIRALWTGLCPSLLMALPSTILYFMVYEQLKEIFLKMDYGVGPAAALSGCIARTLSATVVAPLEKVKTQMQAQSRSAFAKQPGFAAIFLKERAKGTLWKGLKPTLLRDIPFSAVYWMLYERTRSVLTAKWPQYKLLHSFTSGCLAGAVTSVVTMPFDVVKTRVQMGHPSTLAPVELKFKRRVTSAPVPPPRFGSGTVFPSSVPTPRLFSNGPNPRRSCTTCSPASVPRLFECSLCLCAKDSAVPKMLSSRNLPVWRIMWNMQRYEGFTSLFEGLLPRLARAPCACAIMIGTYEGTKSYLAT
eukprot:NODE_1893_length_1264_cov_15.799177_g1566_i0.p1 GENE.NODE_1893_length_1264_cov_15.799177_g1566_i0~~NODE_1893_length_1264_cov_15.799177_g1566_i0.p1  ORF type:complete len:339 (+),score=31.76 NODE_1893_length_1264_cov_15.799177_g1566_i0:35-1018(+)